MVDIFNSVIFCFAGTAGFFIIFNMLNYFTSIDVSSESAATCIRISSTGRYQTIVFNDHRMSFSIAHNRQLVVLNTVRQQSFILLCLIEWFANIAI